MDFAQGITVVAMLTALLISPANALLAAQKTQVANSHRGGQAAAHLSNKGSTNGNPQWSADPERGWVRTDERHKLHEQNRAANNSQANQEKPKGNGKGKPSNF